MAWVFQGNPKRFEIDQYINLYPQLIYWHTPRYQSAIKVGDRAILWRSGASAGAIAVGMVVESPTPGAAVSFPEALGVELWNGETPDPNELRTGIRLDEVRSSNDYLPREAVKADPILSNALLITMPNGTVFHFDELQSEAFARLWEYRTDASDFVGISANEGEPRLRAHYRRERSSFLRNMKVDELRRRCGNLACELCGIDGVSKYPRSLGERIFEVHHLLPLSAATTPARTTLEDLALLCASCHRAVHASADVETNFAALKAHLQR